MQRSKEFLKLYSIPEAGAAEFVLLDHINTGNACPTATPEQKLEQMQEIVGRISIQVGPQREWRLLVFLMRDIDLVDCANDSRLMDLLAYIMHYEDPDKACNRELEKCYLTCEKPENIWLITLQNNPEDTPPCLAETSRPDERGYSAYPSNCRFLRFPLNFYQQGRFGWNMLELHCGVRSLARDILPAELLRGNCTYSLEVELDESELCDETERYGQWLDQIAQGIQQLEQRAYVGILNPDTAPTLNSIPLQEHQVHKSLDIGRDEPENRLKRLEAAADKLLQNDIQEEKRLLWGAIQQLAQWESAQGQCVMTEHRVKQWRERMDDTEQEMLRPQVRKKRLPERIFQSFLRIGDCIINFQVDIGGLSSSLEQETEREFVTRQVQKQEYRYAAGMVGKMSTEWARKLARAFISMLSCCLFTMVAVDQAAIGNGGVLILATLILSLISIVAVYVGYTIYYLGRMKWTFQAIQRREKERVLNSRKYFKNIITYFKLNRVLGYHEQQMESIVGKRALLLREKRALAYYRGIYGQLKICCTGMQPRQTKSQRQGNLLRMLKNDSHCELFGMSDKLPVLMVNGNSVTAAFSFVRSIRLVRIAPRLTQREDAPGSEILEDHVRPES